MQYPYGNLNLPVARHVEFLLVLVLLYTLQDTPFAHTHCLHQCRQILQVEVSVRAAVRLARSWWMLCENLLATERAVPVTAAVGIPTNVAVRVSHVVTVVFVELIICDFVE